VHVLLEVRDMSVRMMRTLASLVEGMVTVEVSAVEAMALVEAMAGVGVEVEAMAEGKI
jgi:hypothetical protein